MQQQCVDYTVIFVGTNLTQMSTLSKFFKKEVKHQSGMSREVRMTPVEEVRGLFDVT